MMALGAKVNLVANVAKRREPKTDLPASSPTPGIDIRCQQPRTVRAPTVRLQKRWKMLALALKNWIKVTTFSADPVTGIPR
jgi:hypothetical protein